MSAALPIPVTKLLQVLPVAPGVTGVIAKVEAGLQGRRRPRLRRSDEGSLAQTSVPRENADHRRRR